MIKKKNGITLITLVITVIVLLILAGVSISILTGDNGIITKSQKAVSKYKEAEMKEEIERNILEAKIDVKERKLEFLDIKDKLIENKITTEELVDINNNQVITTAGYLIEIKEENKKWSVEVLGELNNSDLIVKEEITSINETPMATIKLRVIQIKDGIKKITMPDGKEITYTDKKISVEEKYEVVANGEYKFKIESNIGQEEEKIVEVNNIKAGVIAIVSSTEEWTNENVEVEVIWPQIPERVEKEISINDGEYTKYTGKIEISENCIIKARIRDGNNIINTNEYEVTNIDKEVATCVNNFTEITFGFKAEINVQDVKSGLNFEKCKYKITQSTEEIGIDESLYDYKIESASTTIEKVMSPGIYYIHILLVDNANNRKEYITNNSVTVAEYMDFTCTKEKEEFSLLPGTYKLEVWGAQGGYRSSSTYGGNGGYSVGTLTVEEKTNMYVYVGASGRNGGFNGGGTRSSYYGGGGATDFRIKEDSLYARVIVAGGGGSDGASNKNGMYGGGESGGTTSQSYGSGGQGATQTAGGSGSSSNTGTKGTFGNGGNGYYASSGYAGAGGGGWYGGAGSYPDGSADDDRGGGGGSGYVYTESNASNYPSGCLLNSTYYLTDASTIAGNSSMPSTTIGSTQTGQTGDGYARITRIK